MLRYCKQKKNDASAEDYLKTLNVHNSLTHEVPDGVPAELVCSLALWWSQPGAHVHCEVCPS